MRTDDGLELRVEDYKANIDVYEVWLTGGEEAWRRWQANSVSYEIA